MLHMKKLTLRIQRRTERMPGFSDEERAKMTELLSAGLSILSDIFIRIKQESIPGGLIVLMHVRTMPDGALIILSCQRH